jgi:hypothetical protein
VIASTPPPVYPRPIGTGARYRPAPANPLVADGQPFGRFRCGGGRTFEVHVELFARRQVVIMPPRIGLARSGCRYPLWTTTPTGVVEVDRRGGWTLGDLFAIWGRRVSPARLLSFPGRVSVYVGGHGRTGDPRLIRLAEHDQIVIEVGGYVAPHPSYLFPRGGR